MGVKEGEVDFEISVWTKSSDDSRCLNKCNIFPASINWSLSRFKFEGKKLITLGVGLY